MNNQIYKIVVLGEGRVGKTCISLKYVNNQFNDRQESTINASYLQKNCKLDNGQVIKFAIWDTAGQEKYNSIAPVYYRDALGAIVVYEITSRQSFDKLKKWVYQLEDHAPKGITLTIAGNKADLESKRIVNNSEVEKFAKHHGANHFVVSAKNGQNIKELFTDLGQRIYKANGEKKPTHGRIRNNPKITIQTNDLNRSKSSSPAKKKKKCCQ